MLNTTRVADGNHRGSGPPSLAESQAFCQQLATSHYENFTVASLLVPRGLRPHFYSIYAYCRTADDLADESASPEESLARLSAFEDELRACYAGEPRSEIFVALAETIREFQIPIDPFRDLLVAFRLDQTQTRYATIEDLLDYCQYSANPVGRMILYLGKAHDERRVSLSDSICTGLQLVNFCQDVKRDYAKGRVYLPIVELARHGASEQDLAQAKASPALVAAVRAEVDRAERYLRIGLPLAGMMPGRLAIDIDLFAQGGLATCSAIRAIGHDVLAQRPTVGKGKKLSLLAGAMVRRLVRRSSASPSAAEGA